MKEGIFIGLLNGFIMSERTDRKHASKRDIDAYRHSSSKDKERNSASAEKYHRHHDRSKSPASKESHRYNRDTHSHRSDDIRERDNKNSRNGKDMNLPYNSESLQKSQSSECRSPVQSVKAVEETSTRAAEHVDFNWEEHRFTLDAIFFQNEDTIKKGSVEYDEFWVFLQKYQAFSRKQSAKTSSLLHCAQYAFQPDKFNLPEKYDKRYRVNVSFLSKDVKGLLRHRHGRSGLTEENVATFRCILLHYVDFLQKQKFARLAKVKRDQQNLPIYEHRQEIVDAVARHQVVVVAGDTGCGKSTQVPQYLLSAGYTHIACTQPRRIACISLSRRVAYETLNEYGSEVAYQVHLCEMMCFFTV